MSNNGQQDVDMTDVVMGNTSGTSTNYAGFTDLPGELRAHLYTYILAQDTPDAGFNLADFSLPNIAQVPAIANEVLAVLFAESHFYVQVKSNFADRKTHRLTGSHQGNMAAACGVTRMKGFVRQAVKKAGEAAVFRNVTLRVVDPALPAAGLTDRWVTSHVRMVVQRGNLQFLAVPGQNQNGNWDRQDVDAAVQAVRDRAEETAGHEGFNGFSLRQLEHIIRALSKWFPWARLLEGLT